MRNEIDTSGDASVDRHSAHADAFARLREFTQRRHGAAGTRQAAGSMQTRALNGIRQGALSPQVETPHGACELCSLPLAEAHRHLYEVASGQIVCACDGCALTFEGVTEARYRPVPRDSRTVDADVAENIPWEQLALPINLAFFVRDGEDGGISAYYPSPGGITKSTLPFDSLDHVLEGIDVFGSLEPYVEALLVNRLTQKTEVFVVPIDLCYELTGRIRVNWRGFSGGEDVRREMSAFFDRIRAGARPRLSA